MDDDHVEMVAKFPRFSELVINHKRMAKEPVLAQIWCYYGDSGAGKTHQAIEDMKAAGLKWTSVAADAVDLRGIVDYNGLIWNEYAQGKNCQPLGTFKELGDRFKIKLLHCQGEAWSQAQLIILTSNKHPSHWWKEAGNTKGEQKAIWRRFAKLTKFEGDYESSVTRTEQVLHKKWDKAGGSVDLPDDWTTEWNANPSFIV